MPGLVFTATVTEDERATVVFTFGAAPGVAAITSKRSHEEGSVAIELKVESASTAKTARAGERLPAAGQRHVPGDRNLHRHP